MREAFARAGSFAIGLLGLLAMRELAPPPMLPAAVPPPAPPIVIRAPVAIPTAQPVPVMMPTVVAAVPAPTLAGCPTPPLDDDAGPIGTPGPDLREEPTPDLSYVAIAASPRAPVIAALAHGSVYLSRDDGRRFVAVLDDRDRPIHDIAVDDAGRLYAAADGALIVRDPDGRLRTRPVTCETATCSDHLIAGDGAVAWIHDHEVRVSRDGARWRRLDRDDGAELARRDRFFIWGGALYGTTHVDEDCGWNADDVDRVDLTTLAYRHDTFNDDDNGHARVTIVEDGGASWRYRPAAAASAPSLPSLYAASLLPTVGARALRVEGGALVELCGARGRMVAHQFDAGRIDAVDAAGRPLLAYGDQILRWSPRWGWRSIFTAPPPPDYGSD